VAASFTPQQHVNPPIAITNTRLANLFDPLFEDGLSGATGLVVVGGCVDLEYTTCPSDRHVPLTTHLVN
jgi:hypothetical protein